MSVPEEVHPWTVRWWESLPEGYRRLDAVQANPAVQVWDGLTQTPFDMGASGGWSRDSETDAGYRLVQRFRGSAGEKMWVQVWSSAPAVQGGALWVDVTNRDGSTAEFFGQRVYNPVTGAVALSGYVFPTGDGTIILQVTVLSDVDGGVPVAGSLPVLVACNVGRREVTFEELPQPNAGTGTTYYPLLRWMDGIGQLGGQYRQISDDLWDGVYTNPETCPESSLRWLAQLMGVHRNVYSLLQPDDLRLLLINTGRRGLQALGSREALAEIVRPYLTGDKICVARPHPAQEHTIIFQVRVSEVPGGDLDALAEKVRGSGVVPAGHLIQIVEGQVSWDDWQDAAGETWGSVEEAAPTWNAADTLGSIFQTSTLPQ